MLLDWILTVIGWIGYYLITRERRIGLLIEGLCCAYWAVWGLWRGYAPTLVNCAMFTIISLTQWWKRGKK
jgi:hypothetical protein